MQKLDRILIAGHYMVPLYYAGYDRYAYWTPINRPEQTPIYGAVLETWWMDGVTTEEEEKSPEPQPESAPKSKPESELQPTPEDIDDFSDAIILDILDELQAFENMAPEDLIPADMLPEQETPETSPPKAPQEKTGMDNFNP